MVLCHTTVFIYSSTKIVLNHTNVLKRQKFIIKDSISVQGCSIKIVLCHTTVERMCRALTTFKSVNSESNFKLLFFYFLFINFITP